jgi:hypothetical protein
VTLSTLREATIELEIILAVDDRLRYSFAEYDRLADRAILFPFAPPPDRVHPWLVGQCSGDWILRLDGDEAPSAGLISEIADLLVGEPSLTHAWMPCRWLYPDATNYLAEWPWRPDYQLRLLRNDSGVVRIPGLTHRHPDVVGARRYLEQPLYHGALVLSSREHREQKVARYESLAPGTRVAGDLLNRRYYLPELLASPRLRTVPVADLALARRLVAAPEPRAASVINDPKAPHVSRQEIDGEWPARPLTHAAYSAQLDLLDDDLRVFQGETRTIDVRVHNRGDAAWPWGEKAEPPIRLAQRWHLADGSIMEGLRTPFPELVRPGASCIVPAQIGPPPTLGRITVEIDVVHEHVRWFGSPLVLDFECL